MIARKVKISEIDKLNPLFQANDQKKFIEQRMKKIENGTIDIYILEENDNFIAEVTIVYDKQKYADYTIPNQRVYVEALRVLSEYQGKGLGQYFMKEVMRMVKEDGYTEMTIGVEDDNCNAKHIYEKLGFTEFIKRDKGSFEGEHYEYDVTMRRL